MQERKGGTRGLLILIPIALLFLYVALGDREPDPPPAVAAPVEAPPPRPEDPQTAALVASALIQDPAPEPEPPPPPPKPVKKKKPEPPPPEPIPEPPPAEEPVEDPPADEAPPPPEEPPPEEASAAAEIAPPEEPPKGAVEVWFEDDLSFVRPLSVRVAIDGKVVAIKHLAEGRGEEPMSIHEASIPAGTHTMDFAIRLTGDGGGLFSYVDSYVFTAKQHAVIEVKEDEKRRIFIRTFEKSATDVWENRIGLKIAIDELGR